MARTIEFQIDVDTNLKSVEDLKKEIASLEKEFEGVAIGSEKFTQLGNAIKKSRGQLKDIELQFEALDKEQRAAALVDTFSGLAGAIGAVSGAFIAFGAESEAIEEAEKKLLGIIAVVQGIREVSDAYVASIKLFGPALNGLGKSFKAAFTTANGAINSTKVALASLGIGLLIIAVDQLIANWDKLSAALGFAEDKTKKYNDALLEAEASVQGQIYSLGVYNSIVQDTTRSEEDRAFALEELKKAGVATEDIDLANAESLGVLNQRITENINLVVARTKAQAAEALLADALEKQLQVQGSTLEDNISFWEKAGNLFLSAGNQWVFTIRNATTAAENFAEANADAQAEVERATAVYSETLETLIGLEGQNVATQRVVREELERRAKTDKAVAKALDDRAKAEENAITIARQAALDLEVLRAEQSEKEIVQIRQSYADRLDAVRTYFGEESEEYKALMELMNAEITAVRKQQADDAAQEIADLFTEISEATAVTVQQQRDLELENTTRYYNALIAEAEKNGISTVELEEAKLAKLKQLKESYAAEDEADNNEELEKEKAFRQQLADLAIDSGLSLISSLKELNSIYDKDSEAAAKKSFQRQKSLNMVETIISTYSAAQKAYASQFVPVPTPDSPVRGAIAAAVATAAGLAKLAVISKQKFQTSGTPSAGGAGGASGAYSGGGAGAPGGILPATIGTSTGIFGTQPGQIPTPQSSQQPLRAYVLAGDVTSAQEANTRLNQRRKF